MMEKRAKKLKKNRKLGDVACTDASIVGGIPTPVPTATPSGGGDTSVPTPTPVPTTPTSNTTIFDDSGNVLDAYRNDLAIPDGLAANFNRGKIVYEANCGCHFSGSLSSRPLNKDLINCIFSLKVM